MGSPVEFKELRLPALVIYALQVVAFFRDLIATLCPYIGLSDFQAHEIRQPDPERFARQSVSADEAGGACHDALAGLADKIVPVVRFSDLRPDPGDCCAVCLTEFGPDDEIRRIRNCRHVFHRGCLDRWMVDHHKMTCPVCRDRFVPDELMEDFMHLVLGSGPDVYGLYRWWF
ncbi:PREDICTED: E3 ubiquitin-protein ligase RHA1B-like [Tarenaya hassleriana]|uniref:E3 ubiquitin-protein ligase RHA1B-like n=1 Tax=Tarenaya hassleriana TaxID=28532 RepID=UPI00053C48AE|nr:PREDICTED: E3 ubiquitin-protein ligase RHA1B-like [Tarenaya hassleriana]